MGVLGPWTGAQCGWAPSPPATPMHPYKSPIPLLAPDTYTPCQLLSAPLTSPDGLTAPNTPASVTTGTVDWPLHSQPAPQCTPDSPNAPATPASVSTGTVDWPLTPTLCQPPMHPWHPQWPLTAPNSPTSVSTGTVAQCGWAHSPPAIPQCPLHPLLVLTPPVWASGGQ